MKENTAAEMKLKLGAYEAEQLSTGKLEWENGRKGTTTRFQDECYRLPILRFYKLKS